MFGRSEQTADSAVPECWQGVMQAAEWTACSVGMRCDSMCGSWSNDDAMLMNPTGLIVANSARYVDFLLLMLPYLCLYATVCSSLIQRVIHYIRYENNSHIWTLFIMQTFAKLPIALTFCCLHILKLEITPPFCTLQTTQPRPFESTIFQNLLWSNKLLRILYEKAQFFDSWKPHRPYKWTQNRSV